MASQKRKTIGVVLCGSGYKDGSEIRESVATLWALSAVGVDVKCFAPDGPQTDVVNCLTGQVVAGETRDMRVEAARIARGQVESLGYCNPDEIDGLILPGGFGAAKNLCDFASLGAQGTVRPELQELLQKLQAHRKPIGAICIAPVILGLAFQGLGLRLTVGALGEVAQTLEALGHHPVVCSSDRCIVDEGHRVVTTPAYMDDDASLHDIFHGIRALVDEVVRMAGGNAL